MSRFRDWRSVACSTFRPCLILVVAAIAVAPTAALDAISPSPSWTANGAYAGVEFGAWCAGAGDVNHDGYGDVIVSARSFSNGQDHEGRVYLYLGSASGLAAAPAWTAESNQSGAWFGYPLSAAGDINGDGFDDVLIASQYWDSGLSTVGRVLLYLGRSSGLAATPAWTAEGTQAGEQFGSGVYGAGDVNGDGYDDVIIGAENYSNGQAAEGGAFVYLGGPSGLAAIPAWSAESNQSGSGYGRWVAGIGDVNSDGFDDVAVGAMFYDDGEGDEGRAYVYLGSASGPSTIPSWTYEPNQQGANLGGTARPAGDVNRDGHADFIAGAHGWDNSQTDEGSAWLFLGSPQGLAPTPIWHVESNQSGALLGWSGTAGDVDGDGFDDLIVGAFRFDNGQINEGAAWAYLGGPAGPQATPTWHGESDQAGADYGFPVAAAGDVNGDGADDILVGANRLNNYTGRVYVYHGIPGALDRDGDGYSPFAGDCDDQDPQTHPGAADACDGNDRDCDGSDGVDVDGDLRSPCEGDCDESNPARFLGNPEICDNADNDCDNVVDGFTSACGVGECVRQGFCAAGTDSCVPGAPAPEVCNGLDDNCDGITPPGSEQDADADGVPICAGDCDDTVAATHPSAGETNDGHDNQCPGEPGNGLVDEISGVLSFPSADQPSQICWELQPGAAVYQAMRSSRSDLSSDCAGALTNGPCWDDAELPPSGRVFAYIVRAVQPFTGSWGRSSAGAERVSLCDGRELLCANGVDDDLDGDFDCDDPDCYGVESCGVATFSFIDRRSADDVAADALASFFAAVTVRPEDFIHFRIASPTSLEFEWCAASAAFYRDRYLTLATGAGTAASGSWDKWYREDGGAWAGPISASFDNAFGDDCAGPYSWCSEMGLGGRIPGVAPAETSVCEAFETYDCSDGSWSVTVQIGVDRQSACGF